MPAVFSIGAMIGPFIGGTLAQPYDRFPAFHHVFWEEYPYFLPCAVSASFTLVTLLLTSVLLKETLPRLTRVPDNSEANNTNLSHQNPVSLRGLFVPPIVISISNYGVLAFFEIALFALLPLFYSSSIEYGGLNFSPSTIGILLGVFGLFNGIFQGLFFAKIVKRWGAKNVFITGMICFLPIFLLFPFMSLLARQWGVSQAVWAAVVFQLALTIIMDMSYASIFIFMTSAAPKGSLGAMNGMGQTVASVVRAIGPAMSTSLFALSLQYHLLGGYAVYAFLFVLSGLALLLAIRLPKEPWQKDFD